MSTSNITIDHSSISTSNNWIEISRQNILWNLHQYQNHYPSEQFAPVLKSNASGHGIIEVAKLVEPEKDIPFICVNAVYEAHILRNSNISKKILIIGYTSVSDIANCSIDNVAFTITGLEQLQKLSGVVLKTVVIHLKVDTGMRRQGIMQNEIAAALDIIDNCKHLKLEGICTHFADADNPETAFTERQIKLWNKVVSEARNRCESLDYVHAAATPSVLRADAIEGNVVRLGIGLFGIDTAPIRTLSLRPVLQMNSRIGILKEIKSGERLGYGGSYTAKTDLLMAVVPIGYHEGVDRRLSNVGYFMVKGIKCPIIGRVGMNITSIDVSSVAGPKIDDIVQVISSNSADPNSIEGIALYCETIPQEILAHIPAHIPRLVV